ncbi:hypothetical protein BO71DRAFT_116777 [Aspergillus ellipticus CBS 707.79]|uniref:Uncharacterized protein n=1 Tax=Aspergillus ellipticus CBS 707.79 TaxID=1448320 RepID=A0A319DJM2_9EURO|nr:hypothetical protein BO71DRAFT_116777 [Aspergillus ellipticus CBS 707.79]
MYIHTYLPRSMYTVPVHKLHHMIHFLHFSITAASPYAYYSVIVVYEGVLVLTSMIIMDHYGSWWANDGVLRTERVETQDLGGCDPLRIVRRGGMGQPDGEAMIEVRRKCCVRKFAQAGRRG